VIGGQKIGIISKIRQVIQPVTQKLGNLVSPLLSSKKVNPDTAGRPLSSSTASIGKSFENLVKSSPAVSSPAAKYTAVAAGMPVSLPRAASSPQSSTITGGRAKRTDVTKTAPKAPSVTVTAQPYQYSNVRAGSTDIPDTVLPVAGALGLTAGSAMDGGNNMGWYSELDENLGGALPGGSKLDYGQLATMAGVALAGYGASRVLASGRIYNAVKGMFGGSTRKTYRRRIGVKRSDLKRFKAMKRDLQRLDKAVNLIGVADIKFSRKARG